MPWELDYALLAFTQLKKSKYYLNNEDTVYIDATLNLSSYLINWDKTQIPKEFFIEKFKSLQSLLIDYKCRFKIYDGNQLYGGLNTTFEATEDHIDFYISMNSDWYFSEHLLAYLIESSKIIKNEYFIITPQIPKLWDETWDTIVHPHFKNTKYENFKEVDAFDVRYFVKNNNEEIKLTPTNIFKWAGWFDLHSKKFWEEFYSIEEWNGYGGHDFYTMLIASIAKQNGMDVQQYVLENQVICEYEFGPLKEGSLSKYYKDKIVMNDIPNQRENFDSKMNEYIQNGVKKLKEKNLIPSGQHYKFVAP